MTPKKKIIIIAAAFSAFTVLIIPPALSDTFTNKKLHVKAKTIAQIRLEVSNSFKLGRVITRNQQHSSLPSPLERK